MASEPTDEMKRAARDAYERAAFQLSSHLECLYAALTAALAVHKTHEKMPHACLPVDYEALINKVVAALPDKVEWAKNDFYKIDWFVGQCMKECGGKANPNTLREMLYYKLYEVKKK